MSDGPGPLEFEVVTIFPEAIAAFVEAGLLGKALARDLVRVHCTNPRDFTTDRHRSADDAPFGGGAGMVLKPEPVVAALEQLTAARGPAHRILLTPAGRPFDQRVAERLAELPRIALLCGRYEGIDDRVREHWVDECLSIGDFVLNGGEVAAAVIIEAVARLREGVLGNPESIAHESFAEPETEPDRGTEPDSGTGWRPGLVLEHPHYTRPAVFRGHPIPEVLRSGDHERIAAWRRRSACLRTWALRPQLRPRDWRLAQPVVLAAPADLPADLSADELRAQARERGLELEFLGSRGMRDLKQLRRVLRKRCGADPWVLGVALVEADSAGEGELRGPRLVLDVLAYERGRGPGPLIFWLGDPEHPAAAKQGPEAWVALVSCNRRRRLALADALIDISQPPAARASSASIVPRLFEALRDEGLLPADAGRAPTERETST